MEFGLQFFPAVAPSEKSAQQYWGEALQLVGLCDALGYTNVRTVEHYFHPYGGYSPNPIVFLTAAAMRTARARLITAAVLPAFNHPLKLAGEIGMLDAISGGRLEVGVMEAEGPAGAVLAGPEAERIGAQLDATKHLPGIHEHREAIAGGGPEGRVAVIEKPDLGGDHHPALVTLGTGLERIDGEVLDAEALELKRDPFLDLFVQERHARPLGQSHPAVTSP